MLTVFLAGWGMYRYLRVLSLARWPCLWGAVAFMFAPAFLSFTFAGHYAKMAVIALLPWMYLCLHRGMREGKLSRFLCLALLIGLGAYTPHVQMLQYALIAVGLYFLFQLYLLYRERREKRGAADQDRAVHSRRRPRHRHRLGGAVPLLPARHPRVEAGRSRHRRKNRRPAGPGAQLVPAPGRGRLPCWSRSSPASTTRSRTATSTGAAIPASTTPSTSASSCCCWRSPPCGPGGATRPRPSWACCSPSPWPSPSAGTPPCTGSPPTCCPGARCCASVGMAAFLFAFPAIVLAATGLHQALTAGDPEKQLFRKRLLIAAAALGGIGALAAAAPHTVLELWTSVLYREIAAAKRQGHALRRPRTGPRRTAPPSCSAPQPPASSGPWCGRSCRPRPPAPA